MRLGFPERVKAIHVDAERFAHVNGVYRVCIVLVLARPEPAHLMMSVDRHSFAPEGMAHNCIVCQVALWKDMLEGERKRSNGAACRGDGGEPHDALLEHVSAPRENRAPTIQDVVGDARKKGVFGVLHVVVSEDADVVRSQLASGRISSERPVAGL